MAAMLLVFVLLLPFVLLSRNRPVNAVPESRQEAET